MSRATINFEGFRFDVDTETNTLLNVESLSGGRVDKVVVPHKIGDEITIDEVNHYAFVEIWPDCDKNDRSIPFELVFSSGIKKIGEYVFTKCNRPLIITWPDTCEEIGANLFINQRILSLTGVDNVKEIRYKAFGNTFIESLEWPKACTEIPDSCFQGSTLKKITGIENVKVIGSKAFKGCYINKIEWPKGCVEIPDKCFYNARLKSITGLENVQGIGRDAFSYSDIRILDLSKTKIREMGISTFSWCKDLEKIIWPSGCSKIPAWCFEQSSISIFEGFEYVEEIGNGAFWDSDITKVDLSKSSIRSIGDNAIPAHLKDFGGFIPPYYEDAINMSTIFQENET